jgi:hypothetical protein
LGVRLFTMLFCLSVLAAAQDARGIVRRSVELDLKNAELSRSYTFLQRQETRELDGSGKTRKHDIKTYDVTLLEGSPYRRLVARNDQPLPPKEQQLEEEKLRNSIEQRRKETPEQKERRIADWKRKQEKQREPLQELPDAFDFKIAGEETIDGAAAYIIDATPKPGYRPRASSASVFPKVKARFWIDKKDYQWAKLDMETLDTISFGGILVRLAKGSHLLMEQARINQEVWLPKRVSVQASARVLLVKGYRADILFTFSDYKKFQTESRVVSVGEPQF